MKVDFVQGETVSSENGTIYTVVSVDYPTGYVTVSKDIQTKIFHCNFLKSVEKPKREVEDSKYGIDLKGNIVCIVKPCKPNEYMVLVGEDDPMWIERKMLINKTFDTYYEAEMYLRS